MTRAEEALFVCGALSTRTRGIVPKGSWYALLQEAMGEREVSANDLWGGSTEWGDALSFVPPAAERAELALPEVLPPWLTRAPGAEPRPPRPLAPSSLGEDSASDPPFPPGAGMAAARRGVLIHRLLKRLPELAADSRAAGGAAWLARNAAELDAGQRDAMLAHALAVLAEPDWAELFSPDALAEVPIAALVGDRMVAGTIHRLLIGKTGIRLIDDKTGRRPPASLAEVPAAILRQMAAYVAALEATYPGRAWKLRCSIPRRRADRHPAEVFWTHSSRPCSWRNKAFAALPLPSLLRRPKLTPKFVRLEMNCLPSPLEGRGYEGLVAMAPSRSW